MYVGESYTNVQQKVDNTIRVKGCNCPDFLMGFKSRKSKSGPKKWVLYSHSFFVGKDMKLTIGTEMGEIYEAKYFLFTTLKSPENMK